MSESFEVSTRTRKPAPPLSSLAGSYISLRCSCCIVQKLSVPFGRASNKRCLSITFDQYLKLLDWIGRQIRKDKVDAIRTECAQILERLDCSAETGINFVRNFRKRFRNEAGLAPSRHAFRTTRRESRAYMKTAILRQLV